MVTRLYSYKISKTAFMVTRLFRILYVPEMETGRVEILRPAGQAG